MHVHLGSDHAGFALKARIVEWLTGHGHEPVDHGPSDYDPHDDYPPYVLAAATAVVDAPGSRGVVLGGSGNGEAITANKVEGVRCALVWSAETARLAREHNDANLISIGARMHDEEDVFRFLEIFLATDFNGDERHARRIAMLGDYERSGEIPSR